MTDNPLFMAAIEQVLLTDPGGRGVAHLLVPGDLALAAMSLAKGRGVAIVTGFYIPAAQACETDGPPGALALHEALTRLGIASVLVTDAPCAPVFKRAKVPVHVVEKGLEGEVADVSHWIAIERVGRSRDGRYRNMRGGDISAWSAPLDEPFLARDPTQITTIGIGDGGNEIGMGKRQDEVQRFIANGPQIACQVATDYLVVGGTSNWGAWGLIAALECLSGRRLLPTRQAAAEQLQRFVDAGAVDGVTGQSVPSVDGLAFEDYVALLDILSCRVGRRDA